MPLLEAARPSIRLVGSVPPKTAASQIDEAVTTLIKEGDVGGLEDYVAINSLDLLSVRLQVG